MKDQIGITLTFDNILTQEHIKLLPITHLQILFQNKLQFLYPTDQELYNVRSYLKNKNVEIIVHISVQLCISRSYGKNLMRINQELKYAQKLNAQYIVIHTGIRGKRTKIPLQIFKDRLTNLLSLTRIPILVENTASKQCFGSTFKELKNLIQEQRNCYIVYDTMHHYAAGNDIEQLPFILQDPIIKVIHVNDIPIGLIKGSGQDRHESLEKGTIAIYHNWQFIRDQKAIKILETPDQEKWYEELKIISQKMKTVSCKIFINGKPTEGLVDIGAGITCLAEKFYKKIDPKRTLITKIPNPGIKIKQAASDLKDIQWLKIKMRIGKFEKDLQVPVIQNQHRDVLIGMDILKKDPQDTKNTGYDIILTKGFMVGNGERIPLKDASEMIVNEIIITQKGSKAYEINEITSEQMHNLLRDCYDGKLKKDPFIRTEDYKHLNNREKRQWLNEELEQHKQWILRVYQRPHSRPISEVFIQQLWELRKKAMNLHKGTHGSLKSIKIDFYQWIRSIFNKPLYERTGKYPWENKTLPEIPKLQEQPKELIIQKQGQSEFNYPIYTRLSELNYPMERYPTYIGPTESELEKMSRSRTRSSQRKSRSRSRTRSPRRKSRSRSRTRSPRKRSQTPRPKYKEVYVLTRSGKGKSIVRKVPQNNPQIIIHQEQSGSSSTGSSSTPSRSYSRTPSPFRTPSPSRRISDVPSLRSSRQQSRISTQTSTSSRTNTPSRTRSVSGQRSSTGPQLRNIHQANAGVVINGEIRGIRLQVVFSIVHKLDWMTTETAQRCGLLVQRINDSYLENTYMDHKYEQRTANPIDIRIGQDNQRRDVYITTSDIVPVVRRDNFHNRSQSLQDRRNRLFIIIGMDTIQQNEIRIKVQGNKSEIMIPNQNYTAPVEKKYHKFNAMQYPDLSQAGNLDFNIQYIETIFRKTKRMEQSN